MLLKEYLDRFTGSERADFAKRVEVSYAHLSRLARYHARPSGKVATAMVRESNGELTLEALRPDWFGGEFYAPMPQSEDQAAA